MSHKRATCIWMESGTKAEVRGQPSDQSSNKPITHLYWLIIIQNRYYLNSRNGAPVNSALKLISLSCRVQNT